MLLGVMTHINVMLYKLDPIVGYLRRAAVRVRYQRLMPLCCLISNYLRHRYLLSSGRNSDLLLSCMS